LLFYDAKKFHNNFRKLAAQKFMELQGAQGYLIECYCESRMSIKLEISELSHIIKLNNPVFTGKL